MHGILFKGLKDFVVETYDRATWRQLQEAAGVGGRRYVPVSAYPDEELVALVEVAVDHTGIEQSELLRTFGRYVVPTLVDMYGIFIDDAWTGLDLIENVEGAIHHVLRNSDSLKYEPPEISATRVDTDIVLVTYGSRRGLCAVALGLLEGIGDYYDEPLEVFEHRCRHEGASSCELVAVGDGTNPLQANRLVHDHLEAT
ncbi:heme NO-binding domain-containing protein [Natrinema gelatinilyticum]|uniref:heme NO-binding domain-containing protein n=1 Tax=Natrinema gelatinilyticum TaxID=2961571 RepID=UPI0020C45309|nr:heme NO-binding domain-containing protein [Natrinema gelatinilyticum]